jgi:hypothetical protein
LKGKTKPENPTFAGKKKQKKMVSGEDFPLNPSMLTSVPQVYDKHVPNGG